MELQWSAANFWDFFVCLSRASTFAEKKVYTWSTTLPTVAAYRAQIFVARIMTRDLFALANFLVFGFPYCCGTTSCHCCVCQESHMTYVSTWSRTSSTSSSSWAYSISVEAMACAVKFFWGKKYTPNVVQPLSKLCIFNDTVRMYRTRFIRFIHFILIAYFNVYAIHCFCSWIKELLRPYLLTFPPGLWRVGRSASQRTGTVGSRDTLHTGRRKCPLLISKSHHVYSMYESLQSITCIGTYWQFGENNQDTEHTNHKIAQRNKWP